MPARKILRVELLEPRQLLAVDLNFGDAFDSVLFVESNGASLSGVADPTPVVGQKVYVAGDWTALGLTGDDNYAVHFEMNGVVLPVALTGDNFPGWFHGGWIAQPGATHTVMVTLDADNQIVEDDETNNSFSLQFNTRDASTLPAKFVTPIVGEQNVDWVLGGYVDVDPLFFADDPIDPFEDYQGSRTTTRDFHNGLDIGLPNFAAQDAGVEVLAAAAGMVTEVHDEDFDRETALTFSNEGNRVLIDHGDGWVTQYYHLREGSPTVTVGQEVAAGDVLGLVGSSGNSAGPHLHFEVQHLGSPVEPFIAPEQYFVPSDFDNSGRSTGADFLRWQRRAGTAVGAAKSQGDANGDEAIDGADLAVWESEFGAAPLPYVFDAALPNNLLDFGVTNGFQDGEFTGFGLPLEQFRERPSEVTAFPSGEWLLAWGVFSSVEAGDAWEAQLYRPDNSLVEDYDASVFSEDRPINSVTFNPGVTENIPGVWRVDFLYNDVKLGERFIEVGISQPEMRVFQRDAADTTDLSFLLNGRTTPIDFGSTAVGQSAPTQTFQVENHGYADLTITSVQLPTGFSLVQPLPATIGSNSSANLIVQIDTVASGAKSGVIQIDSNDSDEGAFTFLVEGDVAAASTALLALPSADDSSDSEATEAPTNFQGEQPVAQNAALRGPVEVGDGEELSTRSRVREFRRAAAHDRALMTLELWLD